ncbi:hypothetical protein QYM36_019013, partial [Artemia franciscana]
IFNLELEIGQTTSMLSETSQDGNTHNWEVFVRGKNNAPIENIINRVVFRLILFPDPVRSAHCQRKTIGEEFSVERCF